MGRHDFGDQWKTFGVVSFGPDCRCTGFRVLANGQIHINHWTTANYGGADVSLSTGPERARSSLTCSQRRTGKTFHANRSRSMSSFPRRSMRNWTHSAIGCRLPASPVICCRSVSNGSTWCLHRAKNLKLAFVPIGRDWNREPPVVDSICTALDEKIPFPRWSKSFSMELDRDGSAETAWMKIPVPDQEGVYNLQIELEPSWYQASFKSAFQMLMVDQPLQRTVQFVVIDPQSPPVRDNVVDWRLFTTIDPTNVESNTPVLVFPDFEVSPDRKNQNSLGNELRQPTMSMEIQ